MIDYTRIYAWTRTALRTDTTTLPDADITDYARSSIRRMLLLYPDVATQGGTDLASLSADDFEAFCEGVGYLCAARIIILPRPDGSEIVSSLKIGQLQEQYLVPNLPELLKFYREEAASALKSISFMASKLVANHLAGIGVPKIVQASPTRWKAQQSPNAAGALAMLFSSRQLELFGPQFNDPNNWEIWNYALEYPADFLYWT
jgi:hypothetical protein